MRKELELIETIENYLNGKLSEAEKSTFEKQINSSPELQQQVEAQKQLQAGLDRVGMKQQTTKAFKKYKYAKHFKNWGLGLIVVLAASALVYFSYKNTGKEDAKPIGTLQPLPELNENGEKLWSDADKYLPAQYFQLDPEKDTVIETEKGIVLSIPANCFVDADGKPTHAPVKFEVKEALDANSIIQGGLSSKSGDQPLETAGMFYLNASTGKENLKIDPKNSIYAEIPSGTKKSGMMLFDGKRMPDGTIDWVNPKQLENYLTPVNIQSLDFYPPKYLDSLVGMGHDEKNKLFTDSLYYSFALTTTPAPNSPVSRDPSDTAKISYSAKKDTLESVSSLSSNLYNTKAATLFKRNCAVCHRLDDKKVTGPGLAGLGSRAPSDEWIFKFIKNNETLIKSGDPYALKIYREYGEAAMTTFDGVLSDDDISTLVNYLKSPAWNESQLSNHPVDPAKVKTIWNEKFNNTLIATKEFEERLKYMHSTCHGEVLDLYINNIEKNMCTIDSMAAIASGDPKFYEFASRNNGKVKADSRQLEKLKFYYEHKNKANAEAIVKTQQKFMDEQARLDKRATTVNAKQNEKEFKMKQESFMQEYEMNLKEAYRQLGIPETPPARFTYGTSISTPGWKNVDKFVFESTQNRTTLDYTDEKGKKAVIKYEPTRVQIAGKENYDRVLAYLIPNNIDGFLRMRDEAGTFTESLNELLKYKLVCIGYKANEVFLYTNNMVNLKEYLGIDLIKVDEHLLKSELKKLQSGEQTGLIMDDMDYQQFDLKNIERLAKLNNMEELKRRIGRVIFPCLSFPEPLGERDYSYK